jgi:TolB protein
VDGNVDIFVMAVDGTGLQRLTTTAGNDSVPAWTPDSQQIAFRTTRNDRWQIFLMNADGSDQRLIIDDVGASQEWAFDRMSIVSKN